MTERDAKGRFIKGESGNPGGRTAGLSITALIDAAVLPADWNKIINELLRRALRGDIKAIEMLMDRRFGKAMQRSEITGAEGKEMIFRVVRE